MRWLRDTSGQALVESAVIFSLLLTITLGMIDFGFVLKTYASLITASSAGAFAASNLLTGGGDVTAAGDWARTTARAVVADPAQWRCTDQDGVPKVETAYTESVSQGVSKGWVSTTVSCKTHDLTGMFPSLDLQHVTVRQVRQ